MENDPSAPLIIIDPVPADMGVMPGLGGDGEVSVPQVADAGSTVLLLAAPLLSLAVLRQRVRRSKGRRA